MVKDPDLPEKKSTAKLLEWARRHPAATTLGVVVFAALCLLPFSSRHSVGDQPFVDYPSDDTALFI